MLYYIPALHTHSTTMKSLGTSIVILWDTIKLKPVSTGVLSDSKDDQTGSQQSKIIWMDLLRLKSKIKPLGWKATINTLEVSVHARIGMLSLSVYNVMPGPGLPRLRVHRSPLVTNSGPSAPSSLSPALAHSYHPHHTTHPSHILSLVSLSKVNEQSAQVTSVSSSCSKINEQSAKTQICSQWQLSE